MKPVVYILAGIGAWTVAGLIVAPIIGRWLAHQTESLYILADVDIPEMSDQQIDQIWSQLISPDGADRSEP